MTNLDDLLSIPFNKYGNILWNIFQEPEKHTIQELIDVMRLYIDTVSEGERLEKDISKSDWSYVESDIDIYELLKAVINPVCFHLTEQTAFANRMSYGLAYDREIETYMNQWGKLFKDNYETYQAGVPIEDILA